MPTPDSRVTALAIWKQARAIYLPTGNIPPATSATLAVAIALTELIAAQVNHSLAQ